MSRVADAIADKTLGQFESFLSDLRTGSRNYLTLANSTEQIDHQYRGRGLIELVQNAYDALGDVRPSRVRVELVDDQGSHGALLVANTGRPLTDANFRAMVSLFQSGKRPGEGVGHKGVGFKSVLELTDAPEIFSRSTSEAPVLDGYCFRLDPGTPASWASALRAHGDSPRPLTLELGGRTRTIEAGTIALAREAAERLGLSLEEELQRLSPYLLPLPIASDVRAGELVARGFATLVRLPLRDAAARAEAARQVADLRNGEVLLFLDGLDRLELVESRSGGLSIERVSERNPDESLTILLEDDSGLVTEHRRWDRSLAVAGELTEARSLLPKAWAELARVDLSIAVPAYSAQREPTAGHVFVHFPTRTMSGSAARIQAHFHAELSRQGLTRDRWNDVLMRELVALALDVCARLAASNDPRDLPLLIDLLAPCGGAAGSSVWHTELLEQVRERALFRDRQGQLRALRELRRARPPAGPLVITQELLSDNASFHELAPGYGPRLDELDALAARLGIRLEPTEAEMAATLARVANALADRGGLTEDWAGFYEDCSDLLPNASALLGKRVVIDHHGALQVAGRGANQNVQCFFPPQGATVPVPDLLADRIAFLSETIALIDSSQRTQTRARQYLEPLLDSFDVRTVIERVVLRSLPQGPVGLADSEAKLCQQGLELVGSLLRSTERGSWTDLLRRVRVPCIGGWFEGARTTFGPEWNTPNAEDVRVLATELPEGLLSDRMVLGPGASEWGGFPASLLRSHDFGVRDGLRPEPPPESCELGFKGMGWPSLHVDLFSADFWRGYKAKAARAPTISSGNYRLDGVEWVEPLKHVGTASRAARVALARVVVRNWSNWQLEKVRIVKDHGHYDAPIELPSLVEHMLREVPWIPDLTGEHLRRPREIWYVRGAPGPEARRQYGHLDLMHPDVARVVADTGEAKGIEMLRRVGARIFDLEDTSCARDILEGLADAVGPRAAHGFIRSQLRQAWHSLTASAYSTLPKRIVVDWGGQLEIVATGIDDVFVPSPRRSGSLEGLFTDYPVVVMEPQDAEGLLALCGRASVSNIRSLDEVQVQILTDDRVWTASPDAVPFARSEYAPLAPAILAVFAHSGQGGGSRTAAFREAVAVLRSVYVEHHSRIAIELQRPVEVDAHLVRADKKRILLVGGAAPLVNRTLEPLARPLAEAFERRIHTELQLLLSSFQRGDAWSAPDITRALKRVGIQPDRLTEIQEIWGATEEWTLDRARPVLIALGEKDAALIGDVETLRARLAALVQGTDPQSVIDILARSTGDESVGRTLHGKLGEAFELQHWNAAMKACGRPTYENEAGLASLKRHLRNATGPLRCVARRVMELLPSSTWAQVDRAATDPQGVEEQARQRWSASFTDAMHLVGRELRALGCPADLCGAVELASTTDDLRSRVCAVDSSIDFAIDPVTVLADNRRRVDQALAQLPALGIGAVKEEALAAILGEHGRDLVLRRWSDDEVRAAVDAMRPPAAEGEVTPGKSTSGAAAVPLLAPNSAPQRTLLGEQYIEMDPGHRGLAAIVERFLAKTSVELSLDAIATVAPDTVVVPHGWKHSGPFSAQDAGGRPSQETIDLIGFLGELIVYRRLHEEYGVGPSAWVSGNSDREFPGKEGNDTLGFDFQFERDGVTYEIEVKTTTGPGGEFELSSSEVHAAMRAAHESAVRYLVLEVVHATSHPRLVPLANPFSAEGATRAEVTAASMRVRYVPVANDSLETAGLE